MQHHLPSVIIEGIIAVIGNLTEIMVGGATAVYVRTRLKLNINREITAIDRFSSSLLRTAIVVAAGSFCLGHAA